MTDRTYEPLNLSILLLIVFQPYLGVDLEVNVTNENQEKKIASVLLHS